MSFQINKCNKLTILKDVKDISEDPFDDEYQVPVLTAVFNTVRVKISILQAEFRYYSGIFVFIRI